MDKLTMISTGITVAEKMIPVIEAVAKEIGPFVETELADGKNVWANVMKGWEDFKTALAAVKASIPTA